MIYADFYESIRIRVKREKNLCGFLQKYRTTRNAGKMLTRISSKMLVRT